MSENKKTAEDDARTIRRSEALKLRVEGKLTMRDIAKQLGVSLGTVHNDIRKAIEGELEGQDKLIETARAVEDRRLDEWLATVMNRLDSTTEVEEVAKLLSLALKTSERRSKLLGLDAPVKQEHKVSGVSLDDLDDLKQSTGFGECPPTPSENDS